MYEAITDQWTGGLLLLFLSSTPRIRIYLTKVGKLSLIIRSYSYENLEHLVSLNTSVYINQKKKNNVERVCSKTRRIKRKGRRENIKLKQLNRLEFISNFKITRAIKYSGVNNFLWRSR